MKNILYFIIGFIIIQISNTMLNMTSLGWFNIKPNITLIFICFISLYIGSLRAGGLGLLLGLILDVSVNMYAGYYSLLFLLTGLIIGIFKDKIFKENIFAPILLLAIASFSESISMIIISGSVSMGLIATLLLILKITFINMIFAGLLYFPISRITVKIENLG